MNCGSVACLLRAVNTDQKVTLRPNNLYHFVSDAETAVVIRLCLSDTLKAGKCGQVGAYYLSDHSLYNLAEIQSFPRQVSARHDQNTPVQPYRGMHIYARIHE